MNRHECEAVVVTCIDFRFQQYIDEWLKDTFKPGSFDRVAWAGGIKNLDAIMEQVGISCRLHHIKSAYFINHEDCGAYGEAGTAQKHTEDLRDARTKIQQQHPDISVETYYLHLDGTFESVS